MKKLASNQAGIAHLAIIIVIAAVGLTAIASTRIYSVEQQRKEAARVADEEHEAKLASIIKAKQLAKEEDKEIEIPAPVVEEKPVVEQKPAPKSKLESKPKEKDTKIVPVKVSISSTSAQVNAENVVLTANLPGSYSGTCKALVKLHDGSSSKWFEEPFGPASSCSVTVPRSKLDADTDWKFKMHFYNTDKTVKGESSHNSFSL